MSDELERLYCEDEHNPVCPKCGHLTEPNGECVECQLQVIF